MTHQTEPGTPVEQDEDARVEVDSSPVESVVPVESGDVVPVEVETSGEPGTVEGALMAAPALLLLANSSAMTAATAWHAGGPGGLVGTAAVAGGGAVAAGVTRRAHRAETARRQGEQQTRTGRTPAGVVPDPRTRRQATRDARRAGTAPGTRTGGIPGRTAGAGAGRVGGGIGAGIRGRGAPARGLRSLTGGSPRTGTPRTGSSPTRARGRGGLSAIGRSGGPGGRTGGLRSGLRGGMSRAPGSGAGGTSVGRGTGTGRGGGGRFGLAGRGSGAVGRTAAGRGLAGVMRSGAGGLGSARRSASGAGGVGSARRGAVAGLGSARRGAAAGLGAARRAGAAGTAAVGRGTHAVTGSGPVRRAGAAARGAGGVLRRGAATGRAVAGAARTARGPVAAARAARTAVAQVRAEQDKRAGRVRGRLGRFRAWVAAATAGVVAGGWVTGRWGARGLRAAWARYRGRAVPGTAPVDPDEVGESFDDPDDRRRPGSRVGQPFTMKGHLMVARVNIFQAPAEAAYANAVAYQPEGMLDFIAQMNSLSGPLTQIAAAVTVLAAKASEEFPLDKSVGELLAQIGTAMGNAARSADEISPQIRRMHAPELSRLETPRTGERLWDTRENPA